jgi:hypothetical protein
MRTGARSAGQAVSPRALRAARMLTPTRVGMALRHPRRVPRRKSHCSSRVTRRSLSPLSAGWDGAARHPYLAVVVLSNSRAVEDTLFSRTSPAEQDCRSLKYAV